MIVPFWHGKRVGVTGASGFIGSRLTQELCELGAVVVSAKHNSPEFDTVYSGCDAVFHLAAQTSVPVAEADRGADFESNVGLLGRVLTQIDRPEDLPRVVLASTATIAGYTTSPPATSQIPDHPETVYDEHKLMAEEGLALFTQNSRVEGVSLRFTNVYGPGPKGSGLGRGVVQSFVQKALDGEAIHIYDGGPWIRDYVFVDDIVAALLAAAEGWSPSWKSHYYVGSGIGTTVREMAELVVSFAAEHTGRTVEIIDVPAPENLHRIDRRSFVAPIAEFQSASQWQPLIPLSVGIRATIKSALKAGVWL